jgi:transposase
MRNPTALVTGTIHGQQGGGGSKGKTQVLGIDVSKATLSVTLVDPQTRMVRGKHEVPNTPSGIARLLELVPPSWSWVLEPTGRYSTQVAVAARKARRTVLLARTKQAQAFLRSIQDRAKTDRLDSYGLALYALSVKLSLYPVKSDVSEKIDQLLKARRQIGIAIMSLGQQRTELPHAVAALTAAIAGLEVQRTALDAQIAQLGDTHEELAGVRVLDAIPGIGPITAAAVASCLQDKQFSHPDQFVAYLGLDPRVSDSGTHRGQRRLSKQGNAELRRLLYNCALATCSAKNSPFKMQYERERAKGLSATAALCVISRKMARTCWSLHHHKTNYDPTRVYTQSDQAHPFRETA